MFLFLSSIWASSVLISALIHSCSNKLQFVYFTITSHLTCWKSRKFPISEGKKEILKNFSKCKYIQFITNCWLILSGFCDIYFYFLLNIIRAFFFVLNLFLFLFKQSELRCSYKVCSYIKKESTLVDNSRVVSGGSELVGTFINILEILFKT